jgi:hypothetical protein
MWWKDKIATMTEMMRLETKGPHRRRCFIAIFDAVSISVPSQYHHYGCNDVASKTLVVRNTRYNLHDARMADRAQDRGGAHRGHDAAYYRASQEYQRWRCPQALMLVNSAREDAVRQETRPVRQYKTASSASSTDLC